MKIAKLALLIATTFLLTCCTSVDVRPLPTGVVIKEVLIRENPRVAVSDLIDVLVDGFESHGISAKVVGEGTDVGDAYVVTYVAYRKWDLKAYLSSATIRIQKDGRRIAQAEYSHSGGFGFNKWASTKDKLKPVIDQLLQNVSN